jgi:hypothetical protein
MSTKLKGQNLRIFLDGQVITAALNCQFRIKSNVRDNSTKDTTGDWAQNEILDMGWEVTADSAVWTGEGPGKNTKDLLDYRGALVGVELAVTNGEYNAEKDDVLFVGTAILTSITVTAKNRENSTCNVILTGKDILTIPQWLCDVNGKLLCVVGPKGLTVRK